MKKYILLLFILICSKYYLIAQISTGGIPLSYRNYNLNLSDDISTITLPELDNKKILNELKGKDDSAMCMGKIIDVKIDLIKDGYKTMLDNENMMYRAKIISKNAKSIHLLFNKFHLSESSEFFVYSPDYSNIVGAFTKNNNKEDEKFAIQPIMGDEIILELVVNKNEINKVKVQINHVSHNFVDIYKSILKSTSSYTDCFLDVYCDNFIQNQVRSVMRWDYYDTKDKLWKFCSCALLNQDVNFDELKYYVLSAEHCGDFADLSTSLFYFNYQERDCNTGNGTLFYSTRGATQLAKSITLDMFLMELIESPPEDYNVHFAGWDRTDHFYLWPWVVGIHHPHGWVKKSSRGDLLDNTDLYKWRVEWDEYPVSGGSSGSPLFEDFYGRVIGQLSWALWDDDCSHPSQTYHYGKLRKAWTGTSSSNRLKDWLDPDDNDEIGIDGRDPCFSNVVISGPNKNLRSAQANYQPRNNVIIQASNELSTSNTVTILSGADFTFRAGNHIRLNPGFRVEIGAALRAEIAPCTNLKYGSTGTKSVALNPNLTLQDIRKEKIESLETESFLIKVYPNPFITNISIDFFVSQKGNYTIKIINTMGETIRVLSDKTFEIGSYSEFYDVSDLPNGIYLLSIYSEDIVRNIKLIK